MKGKRMSRYMKIYLCVVAFFVIVLIVACIILWKLLAAYEQTRPRYVAEQVYNEYFTSEKVGQLVNTYSPEMLKFETVESFNEKFCDRIKTEKLEFFSVSSDGQGNEQYAVACENKRVAYFTVSQNDKEAGFGFKHYELSDAEVFLSAQPDLVVKLPKNSVLSINGQTVDNSYITETDIKDASYDYMPKNVEGIMYDKYTVKDLLFEPVISAFDGNGAKLELVYDDTEECYIVPTVYDPQLEKQHSQYVIQAVSEYTKFLSNDAVFGAVSGYLDKNYDIYKRVRSIQVTWVRDHSGYDIYNEKATEFIRYTDDVFSCRVTLTESLSRVGYKDHIENIDVTLYLHKVGDKYLIYEIVNN